MRSRRTPVVAVLGSGEQTDLAFELGAEVARLDAVVLTGGGRGAPAPAVTESALAGAEAARREHGVLAARVGVLGRRHHRVVAEVDDDGTRIVLGLDVGDRRNYLNAHLCDVALALRGGDGTTSEVAFCLALGRPVVLVGDWQDSFPLSRSRAAYEGFLRGARRRVPEQHGDHLDRLVGEAYAALDRAGTYEHVAHRGWDTAAAELVDVALAALAPVGPRGAFPDLRDPLRRPVAERYAAWLADVDRRLTGGGRE